MSVDRTSETSAAEALESGRYMFARNCAFAGAAARIDQLPQAEGIEVAFAGRSNVGKSSLINALTGRKTLARTSNTPGRTRQINFFTLDSNHLRLVDLPGYGYARAAKTEIAAWTGLVDAYLRGRPNLRRTMLLIDSRHGIKPSDAKVMARLDHAAVPYQFVLTKTDKVPSAALERRRGALEGILNKHPAAYPVIITTSARNGAGVAELRAALAALAASE